jgi:hypothetical protein
MANRSVGSVAASRRLIERMTVADIDSVVHLGAFFFFLGA